MGYFNYRFIRELLKNKKIKKLLLFIIIFIIIIILKTKVFAVVEFTYNNTNYTLQDFPGSYKYNIILYTPPKSQFSPNSFTVPLFYWIGCDNPIFLKEITAGLQYSSALSYNNVSYTYGTARNIINNNTNPNFSWSNYSAYGYQSTEKITGYLYSSVSQYQGFIAYSDFDVYVNYLNGTSTQIYSPPQIITNFPHFLNDAESLSIGGQSIIIQPGDFTDTMQIRFAIQSITEENNIISYNNLFRLVLDKNSEFYKGESEGFYYSVPWNFINQYLELSKKYNYVLAWDYNNETQTEEIEILYGGNTPEDAIYNQGLSQQDLINQQTDAINNQTQVIEEQTQAIEGINNTISDPSIDTGVSDLPSINVTDPTQNGINNIFQLMYNAFCVGEPQDIVFPFPYTNQQIVLPVNYLRNNLQNSGSSWILTYIQVFWGYLFGGYVVFDITEKMNKIKEGNIEEIEKNNIKEDML